MGLIFYYHVVIDDWCIKKREEKVNGVDNRFWNHWFRKENRKKVRGRRLAVLA